MLVWYAAWRVRPGVKFFDYALLGDDIVIADPVVAKSYLEVMEECKVTISKEKSLISNVSALEFAKRLLVYKVTLYFSPVSLRVLRTLSSGVSAFLFSELRVNLLCSYRLRGGSYKVYSRQGLPTLEAPFSLNVFADWHTSFTIEVLVSIVHYQKPYLSSDRDSIAVDRFFEMDSI